MTLVPFPVSAVPCGMVGIPLIAEERGDRGIGTQTHGTARTAVAPAGFALGLPPGPLEGDHAGATVSGAEIDADPVYEHDRTAVVIR